VTDTIRRDALARSIAARLLTCNEDELRVLDAILGRLELGRDRYGHLDLSKARDWDAEEAEELLDARIYRACDVLRRRDAQTSRMDEALRELRNSATESPRPLALDLDFGDKP